MSALIRLCERLIEKGRVQGMQEKLNQLLLFGQISEEDYKRLMSLLHT